MLIRLQKYLADSGVASRRKAESLILAGQIKVNGQIVKKLGTKIDPSQDKIYYQNKLIQMSLKKNYIMLNKPKGYTSTTRKFTGEKNILDLVKIKEKIYPVGRLDKDSQGLIFLTNDGDWAYKLTHPKFQIEKEYLIEINKPIKESELKTMKNGLKIKGEILQIKNYKIIKPTQIDLILTQGHKREIKNLFSHFGYQVLNLKRIRIDKWSLGNLPEGQWQYFQP